MINKEQFNKQLLSIVVPMVIQTFMLALVSATDAIMLGLVDQTSLSAVSLGGQIQFVLNLFVTGICAGASILVAQYWGKGDTQTIEKIFPIGLRANLIAGLIFTLSASIIPQYLMAFLTNDATLIASGTPYLRAVALSYFLCGVSQIYLTVLRTSDRAGIASRISAFAVIINIILNAILIFGLFGAPKLGIVGAAIATVVARFIELVWSVFEIHRADSIKVLWSRILVKEEKILRNDFWKYTFSVLAAALVWGIAYTLYSVVMGHMGGDAVAANSIAGITKNLISCGIIGLGNGAGIMVGNVLGTGNMPLAKAYGARLTHMAIIFGIITGLLLMLLSPVIVHFVPLTETAAHYLQYMLLICAVNIMFQSPNHTILDGVFYAGGDSIFDMYGNLGAMWSFTVPFSFLAAFVLHLPVIAVYGIVNLDEIVKIPVVYWRYKKYIWLKDITR